MFQVLNTKGSYIEVGRDIGETFRKETQIWIDQLKGLTQDYKHQIELVRPYISISEKYVPDICKMVRGMAEGGNISYEESFFLSTRELVDPIYDPEPDHCTIAVSFGKDGAVVGHNEDFVKEVIDDLYILNTEINGVAVMSLAYKSILPGTAASLNSKGLAQCINELNQNNLQIGVSKGFISCAVMFQESLEAAEEFIKTIPRASGFNHVLVSGDKALNIEIAGQEVSVDRISGKPYVHTNHYLSEDMEKFEKHRTESSIKRFERATQLVHNNMTEQEMMNLLSDRQDGQFPISRLEATIGSVVIIPKKREMFICYGPPTSTNYKRFTL